MFYKKRKAAERRARLEKLTPHESKFAADLAAAAGMTDPAEKIVRLTDIESDIGRYIKNDMVAVLVNAKGQIVATSTEELVEDIKGHIKKLGDLGKQSTEIKKAEVAAHADEICRSLLFAQVLEVSGLSKEFAAATAGRMTQLEEELAAAQKAAQLAQAQQPAPKLNDYAKLRKILPK